MNTPNGKTAAAVAGQLGVVMNNLSAYIHGKSMNASVSDVLWCAVWHGVRCDIVWCDVMWYGMVWYGLVWFGMVWYIWYGIS